MEFNLLYPDLHRALEEGHVFPHKGVAAADSTLSLAFQKALDGTMVSTFTSNTEGRRGFAYELSGLGQKLSPRDVAPEGHAIHGRREKKKSRHYRPMSCPSAMKFSVVQTTAAASKDPAIARLAETDAKSLKVLISRLHNHSCVDPDLRRHVEPMHVEKGTTPGVARP